MAWDHQAVLNTKVHMGGLSYDKDGDDTYQLVPWPKDVMLTEVQFYHVSGGAKTTKVEIRSREVGHHESKVLWAKAFGKRDRVVLEEPKEINTDKDRLYIRLTALGELDDVKSQNHAQLIFRGDDVAT